MHDGFFSSFDSVLWMLSSLSDHISFLGSASILILNVVVPESSSHGVLVPEEGCVKSAKDCLSSSWPRLAQAMSIYLYKFQCIQAWAASNHFSLIIFQEPLTFIHFSFSSFLLPWYTWLLPHIIIIQAQCFYPARYVLFILCPSWQQTCGYKEI